MQSSRATSLFRPAFPDALRAGEVNQVELSGANQILSTGVRHSRMDLHLEDTVRPATTPHLTARTGRARLPRLVIHVRAGGATLLSALLQQLEELIRTAWDARTVRSLTW